MKQDKVSTKNVVSKEMFKTATTQGGLMPLNQVDRRVTHAC